MAFDDDPAGTGMASHLAKSMDMDRTSPYDNEARVTSLWRSKYYDMMTISTPAISADWLGHVVAAGAKDYDGYVFLSRHSAESGVLALTCHSTGNFGEARFGGNDSEVAIPHPHLQKAYLRNLYEKKAPQFAKFDITIEATHHGPSALEKPTLFIEIGTTPEQWNDARLCGMVADVVHETLATSASQSYNIPVAVCFGGTHYPEKFTDEILNGKRALGTVVPKRAIRHIDEDLFSHILRRNDMATEALLDWGGISGGDKKRLVDLLSTSKLKVSHI